MIRHPLLTNKNLRLPISSSCLSPKGIPRNLFKEGEKFTGTIMEIEQGGRVTVSGKGLIFTAHSSEALAKGHLYEFLVTRVRPRIELKVISSKGAGEASTFALWAYMKREREQFFRILNEICALTKTSRALPKTVAASLQELVQWMGISPANLGDTEGREWIIKFLEHSGIFFEGKLKRVAQMGIEPGKHESLGRDLKGLLLKIMGALEKTDMQSQDQPVLAEKVIQMLHFIEAHQILNLHTMEANMGWFWFIPFFYDGRYGAAELLTKRTSEDIYIILVNITLSILGHVQARVELNGNSVSVAIYLESTQISQFVGRHGELLKQRMALQGLNLASFVCTELEQDEMAMCFASAGQGSGFHMEV